MSKDFGQVGAKNQKARGIKVVSAIGVDPRGIPLGMAAMTYWVRKGKQVVSKEMRTVEEKELKHWIATFQKTIEHLNEHKAATLAWFQSDREGDAWPFCSIYRRMAISSQCAGAGIAGCDFPAERWAIFTTSCPHKSRAAAYARRVQHRKDKSESNGRY